MENNLDTQSSSVFTESESHCSDLSEKDVKVEEFESAKISDVTQCIEDDYESPEMDRKTEDEASPPSIERTQDEERGLFSSNDAKTLFETIENSAEENDEEDIGWKLFRKRRESLRERVNDAVKFPVHLAEHAKEELPACSSINSWTERVEQVLDVIFTGFIVSYKKPVENEVADTIDRSELFATDTGTYLMKISEMVHDDVNSVIIDWDDLRRYCPMTLDWLKMIPLKTISTLEAVVTRITHERYARLYASRKITCRIKGYVGVDSIRRLNTESLNYLVCVKGVVVRRSNIIPRLKLVYFRCMRCQCSNNGPFEYKDELKTKIRLICHDCQRNGPFTLDREKIAYENYQKIHIQEPPNRVIPGQVPRQIECIIVGDLVDTMRPGDEIRVTGIHQTKSDLRLNSAKLHFPVFSTKIFVNNLERQKDISIEELTAEDIAIIHRLSRNRFIREKIIDSMAPTIWGHRHVKAGLAYTMFGGVQKHSSGNHQIRGDINFLIIGDPGLGKSQFLKYVEKTFDRTVYTTGKGASAVGLTAAVRKDPSTGEWMLEGGGLVLADQGICLIDEFDKMSDQDRVSIHEAMEQQSISISKAGIVATLKARCSVIAAANPVFGHYNSSLTFSQNVDLTDPILSRFDIFAVLKDNVNPILDENLAWHVVNTHAAFNRKSDLYDLQRIRFPGLINTTESHNDDISRSAEWVSGKGRIPQSFLRKYIFYAKHHCFPQLRKSDGGTLAKFYSEIRQASLVGGGVPMTVRHLESIIRMAHANARMRLSSTVERMDIDFAISTMLESFIQCQKHAIAINLGRRFGKYRALASSPDEFLETILLELLSRKAREFLRQQYKSHASESLDTQVLQAMKSIKVSFGDWVAVLKSIYSLPEEAARAFIKTERFSKQFGIEENPEKNDDLSISIRP